MQAVNIGRKKLSANHQLWFRLFKALLFLTVLAIIITLSQICQLSFMDLVVCCLAFLPTGWGLIMVSLLHNTFSLGLYLVHPDKLYYIT